MFILEIDYQVVVNSKIIYLKDIINLVKDIRILTSLFKDISVEYCHRVLNRDADKMTKSVHAYVLLPWVINKSFFMFKRKKKEEVRLLAHKLSN